MLEKFDPQDFVVMLKHWSVVGRLWIFLRKWKPNNDQFVHFAFSQMVIDLLEQLVAQALSK